jgi:hypothetical protein
MKRYANLSESDIQDLTKPKFAKSTTTGMQAIENLLRGFCVARQLPDIPSDKAELIRILKEFWPSVRQTNGEEFKAGTLRTYLHLLRSQWQHSHGFDILCDPDFHEVNVVFNNYTASLKKRGKGCVKHHPHVTKEDIHLAVETLNEDDPRQLQFLTWLFIQLYFCRRGMENMAEMRKDNILIYKSQGTEIMRLRYNEESKNHKELNQDEESGARIVEIQGAQKCPLRIIKKYISKLSDNEFLWQVPLKRTDKETWYERKLGKNAIASFMKTISTECALSKTYTNHSLRASACTILGELGFSDIDVQAVSLHKSISSLAVYKRPQDPKKAEMARQLSNAIGIQQAIPLALQEDLEVNCLEEWSSIPDDKINAAETISDHLVALTEDVISNEGNHLNVIGSMPDAPFHDEILTKTVTEFFNTDGFALNELAPVPAPAQKLSVAPSLSFQGCTNITINFNVQK